MFGQLETEENPVLKLEQKLDSRTKNHVIFTEQKVDAKGSIPTADIKELLG
jgi:hypothetical protein